MILRPGVTAVELTGMIRFEVLKLVFSDVELRRTEDVLLYYYTVETVPHHCGVQPALYEDGSSPMLLRPCVTADIERVEKLDSIRQSSKTAF